MKRTLLAFFGGVLLTSLCFILFGRIFSGGEDTWLCQGGQWVRHGNPSAPMPSLPCASSLTGASLSQTSLASTVPPSSTGQEASQSPSSLTLPSPDAINSTATVSSVSIASAGENVFRSFSTTDFSFSYPDWKAVETAALLEPARTRVAVSQGGCGIIVTARPLPSGEVFRTFMGRLLAEQTTQAQVKLLRQDITDKTMHVEGEFVVGNRVAATDQYGYLTSTGQFYSLVFAAEKSAFPSVCGPYVAEVVKSVTVR